MKRKEIFLNISLVFLVALTIFQSRLLWIEFPKRESMPSSYNIENSRELFKEFFKPKKMIANFGNGYHSVYYSFNEIYKKHEKLLADMISSIDSSTLKSVTLTEYLDLQNNKSIVYKFNKPLNGNIFLNILGFNKSKKENNLQITEIYISNDKCIVSNGTESYLINFTHDLNIDSDIDFLSKSGYIDYKNLYQLYGLEKNLYFSQYSNMPNIPISYLGGLMELDRNIKNNMAERFLDQKIDYIREITQAENTTYVYKNKFLKLLPSDIIEYENQNPFKNTESNLYSSLESAITFIATKTGQSKSLYLSKVEPIANDTNKGFLLYFDLTENNIPVALTRQSHFIEVEVYSTHVKKFKQVYIKSDIKNNDSDDALSTDTLDKIVKDNITVFDKTNTLTPSQIISQITDISTFYLDTSSNATSNKLTLCMRILYGNKEIFFSRENSKFIMER